MNSYIRIKSGQQQKNGTDLHIIYKYKRVETSYSHENCLAPKKEKNGLKGLKENELVKRLKRKTSRSLSSQLYNGTLIVYK